MSDQKAFVSEIYSSVQGEGPFAGEKQVFFRLASCPLRCRYCDTPASLTAVGHKQMTVSQAVKNILRLARKSKTKTISVTGGEPLVYSPFLKLLFPRLKRKGLKIYLETAGVHPERLKDVVPFCDIIAMDVKLPSATGRVYWDEHKEFLNIGGKKVFVKMVLEKSSHKKEIKKVINLLASRAAPPLLVIQPSTPIKGQTQAPTADQIAAVRLMAANQLFRVLVMPQQHKIWKAR
jgi:organic radical activating enzyme